MGRAVLIFQLNYLSESVLNSFHLRMGKVTDKKRQAGKLDSQTKTLVLNVRNTFNVV